MTGRSPLWAMPRILGLWVLRDQRIIPKQAGHIAVLYFGHIGNIESDFAIWHLTWAVSNFYRNGDPLVKRALADTYADARCRAKALGKENADEKVNGDKVYMGFSHFMGYGYARQHIVAPGNRRYLQSYSEYRHSDSCE
jgi:hypothetical protein